MEEYFPCSTSLPARTVICVVHLSHSDRFKIEFQNSFNLHFHGSSEIRVKIAIQPEAIYRFNEISIKTPTQLFADLERRLLSLPRGERKQKQHNNTNRIAEIILKNKKITSSGISIFSYLQP